MAQWLSGFEQQTLLTAAGPISGVSATSTRSRDPGIPKQSGYGHDCSAGLCCIDPNQIGTEDFVELVKKLVTGRVPDGFRNELDPNGESWGGRRATGKGELGSRDVSFKARGRVLATRQP